MKIINCTKWEVDQEYAIFPVGARDKTMLWSPVKNLDHNIQPNWPYLFKESIASYPDQFWTEIVAYLISLELKVITPEAFPALRQDDSGNFVCGALIKWFYDVQKEKFVHASQYFQRLNPDFDNDKGSQHNIRDFLVITRTIRQTQNLRTSSSQWLSNMVLFDALIGNTDRHQENWGFIFFDDDSVEFSPLFDNGTSLGHERFTHKVSDWDEEKLAHYIEKGFHHIRHSRSNPKKRIQLFDFVKILSNNKNEKFRIKMSEKLSQFDLEAILKKIWHLTEIDAPTPFTAERAEWISRILNYRYNRIACLLEC